MFKNNLLYIKKQVLNLQQQDRNSLFLSIVEARLDKSADRYEDTLHDAEKYILSRNLLKVTRALGREAKKEIRDED